MIMINLFPSVFLCCSRSMFAHDLDGCRDYSIYMLDGRPVV